MKRALLIALLCLLSCIVSCSSPTGLTRSSIIQWREELREDGTKIIEAMKTVGESIAPFGAKEIGAVEITKDGIKTKETTTWQTTEDALTKGSKFFYLSGIALLVAGIVIAIWLKQFVLGGAIGAAGGAVLLAPTIIPQLAPLVVWVVVGAIIVGLVYLGGKVYQSWKTKKQGQVDAEKLKSEGASREAVAILRATDPAYNRNFSLMKDTSETKNQP